MSDRQKTILIVAAILLVFIVAGFFLYRSFTVLPGESPGTGVLPTTQGTGGLPTSGQQPGGGGAAEEGGVIQEPKLFQIHDRPIVNFVVLNRAGHTYARFIEQGSGHVYEYDFATKAKIRISNTSVPGIQSATWAQDGNTVAFQYLEDGVVRTAVGTLTASSTEGSFAKITFLPAGLGSIALSPQGDLIAYVGSRGEDGAVFVAQKDGSGARLVFTSPLSRWLLSWKSSDALVAETPLSTSGGVAYSINPKTGARKLLHTTSGPFGGLVPAADGTTYLYTPSWSQGTTRLDTKSGSEFLAFAMNTIPEKCSFIATSTDYALCGVSGGSDASILTKFENWLRGEGLVRDYVYVTNFKASYWAPVTTDRDVGDQVLDIEHIESGFDFAAFKEKQGQTLFGIRLGVSL